MIPVITPPPPPPPPPPIPVSYIYTTSSFSNEIAWKTWRHKFFRSFSPNFLLDYKTALTKTNFLRYFNYQNLNRNSTPIFSEFFFLRELLVECIWLGSLKFINPIQYILLPNGRSLFDITAVISFVFLSSLVIWNCHKHTNFAHCNCECNIIKAIFSLKTFYSCFLKSFVKSETPLIVVVMGELKKAKPLT